MWWYNDSRYNTVFDKLLDPWPVRGTTSLYEVKENENGMSLAVDLPGAKSSDLKVESVSNLIKISGKQKSKDFMYEYSLHKNYDPLTGTAKLEDGVLTLSFKRIEPNKPKTHTIQIK